MINSIRIPPLRERIDDIPLLAEHFLRQEVKKTGKKIRGFSAECLAILKRYYYRNNGRELFTIVASAIAKEESDLITVASLPATLQRPFEPGKPAEEPGISPES
jgi:DNA-binding NtrC family response regulator